MQSISANFGFLAEHDAQLVRLGALAERYFKEDPATSLIKLRQFGETLAQLAAAKSGLFRDPEELQADLLRRLKFEKVTNREVGDLFHHLRTVGNRASHENVGTHADALTALKFARELGIWFHRTFGNVKTFAPGAFVPPPDPIDATKALTAELARLRAEVDQHRTSAEKAVAAAAEKERARLSAEEAARKEHEERAVWEHIAAEAEKAKLALAAELTALQEKANQAPTKLTLEIAARAEVAAAEINIDEASTRALIDAQLRARGWEADTPTIRYSLGSRPVKGKALAIAEWPTGSGPADYALFVGTRCVGVVEAKRRNKNVSSHIDQAQRYARTFRFEGGAEPVGDPWPDGKEPFLVPFVFSANGRPYLKQLETESGIWFRDVRRPSNHRRALTDWPTPDGLLGMLEIDIDSATEDLKTRSFDFGFPLRPYQRNAIQKVETELADERRNMLLAMATGTGKTKLAIAMLYRLLAAKRFRRVCFVVDRNALGTQAGGEFSTTRIVSAKTFADIFGLEGLKTAKPDPETKVHICTIQGIVKRVLFATNASDTPPVDQYDLMVVDECHRGEVPGFFCTSGID